MRDGGGALALPPFVYRFMPIFAVGMS